MRRYWWSASFGMLVLALLLSGCGATTVAAERAVHTKPTPTPTAKPTPKPTPSPTPAPEPCGHLALHYDHFTVGDLVVGVIPSGFGYAGRKLPDGLALKPYQLPAAPGEALDQQLPLSPMVNLNLMEPAGGYSLYICNNSGSQPHVISSVALQIASLTPYSGQLNEWMSGDTRCANYFVRPQGLQGGGCGGGYSDYVNCMHVTFPDGATNSAIAPAIASGKCSANIPLPTTLQPQQALDLTLGITSPTTPGTYTFAFGIGADGAAATFSPWPDQLLLAPIAHKWSGDGCQPNAMQAQIPAATTPPTYYICPEA